MTDYHHEFELKLFINDAETVPCEDGDIANSNGVLVQQFRCDRKLGAPDLLSFSLDMMHQNKFVVLDKLLPGTPIRLVAGYGETDTIFDGEAVYIKPRFGGGQNIVEVVSYTKAWRLTVGNNESRAFGDGFEATIDAKKLLDDVVTKSGAHGGTSDGLSVKIGSSDAKMEYKSQIGTTDFAFIGQITGGAGFAVKTGSTASELVFQPVELTATAKLKIHRERPDAGDVAVAVKVEFYNSPVRQIKEVWVRGYDHAKHKGFVGKATAPSATIGGKAGTKHTGKMFYGGDSSGKIIQILDAGVGSADEAKGVAQAFLDDCSMYWMGARVTIEGRPSLSPGDVIELVDFGKRFSGNYLIKACQHVWSGKGGGAFLSVLEVHRNGSPA